MDQVLSGAAADIDDISGPRGLLEHCLGVIEEVQMHYQASAAFADDMRLAIGQLRLHINSADSNR